MSKSSKLLTQAGSIAALCFMFVAFQNCGKQMQFAPADGFEFKDAHIIGIEDDTIKEIDDDSVTDNGGDDQDLNEDDTTVVNPPIVSLPPEDNRGGNGGGDSGDSNDNDNDNDSEDDVVLDTSGDARYVCILNGSGKSLKLGIIANSLSDENTSASRVVCVTQNGCLNIASQKFSVKEARDGLGYCKSDSSRVHLDDSQLQELLDNSN